MILPSQPRKKAEFIGSPLRTSLMWIGMNPIINKGNWQNTSSIDRCSNMFQHVEIDFLWLKTFQHVSTCFHLYGGKHVDEILHQTVWSLPSQKSTKSSAPRVPRNSTASVQNPHHSRKYWLVYKFFHGLSILEDDNMSAIILDSLPYPHIPWNSS